MKNDLTISLVSHDNFLPIWYSNDAKWKFDLVSCGQADTNYGNVEYGGV